MPSASSARSRSASVRGLMPWHECSSWEKRRGPSDRSWTRSAVHLAPMISAEAATAQVPASWTGSIVRVISGVAMSPIVRTASDTERGRAGFDLRYGESRNRPEALGRLARLGHAGIAGDRQEDEGVLHREAVLVDKHPRRLLADELKRVRVVVRGGVGEPAVGQLRDRPRRLLALEHVEADVDLACDLHAGETDLPVAHGRVHVADGEHPARLAHGEEDLRALAVQVIVEVAAVHPGEPVGELLAAGRHADDAHHRPSRERDALVLADEPVLHLEHPGQRLLHLVDELAEAGDERGDAPFDGTHVEDLRDERVAGLRALHRDGPRRRVDAGQVDLGYEV